MPEVGVPNTGVTKVGVLANTRAPVPVSSVTAAARFALDGVASHVATLLPRPEMPVETGKPVQLVSVPEDGVPRAPPLTTNAPADPVLTPSAVTTPVPVVMLLGAAPAPPPTTNAFAASAVDEAIVPDAVKANTPPLVPLVNPVPPLAIGSVPVTLDARLTESVPPSVKLPELVTVPVSVKPLTVPVPLTEVTVPPPPVAAIVIEPEPLVMLMPLPAVNVAFESVLPVELPINNWPSVYDD